MRRIALALVLVLGACAAGGSGTTEPDRDLPLLQISHEGGFVPVDFLLTQGPQYTLTRDGLLISPGVLPAVFPGPLVTPYWAAQVTPGELDQLRDRIEEMGLPEMTDEHDDSAASTVADAPTTVATNWDDEGTPHRYSVHALGIVEPGRAETRALQEILSIIEQLAGRDATDWQAERYQFVAIPGALDPSFTDEMQWPIDEGVDTWAELAGMRCAVLDAAALAGFAGVNQATTFPSPDPDWTDVFRLAVRPLLPGETGCELPE